MKSKRSRIWIGIVITLVACSGPIAWIVKSQSTPNAVLNPVWSPTGNYIAAECSFGGWDYPDFEVCLFKPNLTNLIRLKNRVVFSYIASPHLAWSPSGSEIAFESYKGLVIASIPSGDSQLVLNAPCLKPTWSPDGKQIACALGKYIGSDEGKIILFDVALTAYRELTTFQHDSSPTWIDNASALAYFRREGEHNYSIYKLDLASLRESLLVSDRELLPSGVVWSPSGDHLAYPSNSATGLNLFDIKTLTHENLLQSYNACFRFVTQLRWSHNERYIAFIAARDPSGYDAEIWLVDISSKQVFQLTQFQAYSVGIIGAPSWAPDDSRIATSFSMHGHYPYNDEVLILPVSPKTLSSVSCK